MMKLSKYEKETIINWNEGETIASIYTFKASLNLHLQRRSEAQTGRVQPEVSAAVPIGKQYHGGRCNLCD